MGGIHEMWSKKSLFSIGCDYACTCRINERSAKGREKKIICCECICYIVRRIFNHASLCIKSKSERIVGLGVAYMSVPIILYCWMLQHIATYICIVSVISY